MQVDVIQVARDLSALLLRHSSEAGLARRLSVEQAGAARWDFRDRQSGLPRGLSVGPLFRFVDRPWQMGLLGFVFGLSFDTASEVALFGISATQVSHGAGFGAALVYPALFAASMSLLDTTDGVMMVGAYHWAVADPLRKLRYNLTITLMSIAVALFIGGIEICTLIVRWFGMNGPFARGATSVLADFNFIGIIIVTLFGLAWLISAITFRLIGRMS